MIAPAGSYLKRGDVHAGDVVEIDGGFTCTENGTKEIFADAEGALYFRCDRGSHYLAGQLNENGEYIGLLRIVERP